MKSLLIIPLLLTGCCFTKYTYTGANGHAVSIINGRLLWTTDGYNVSLTTNGASIVVTKSSTDNAGIEAATKGAVEGAMMSK